VDEAQAIQRLKTGDIGGLEVLVRTYQVLAVRAAYLVVRDLGLARELTQEAFVRAFERIDSFDAHRPFKPWFMKLVLNGAVDAASKRGREVELQQAESARPLVDPDGTPETYLERAETADEVWAALRSLSPAERAVVVQRYYLELTEAEMAAALGRPRSTIKWRLHVARRRLRTLLRPVAGSLEGTR
jgi:RNA polymerase sigma-70 factor, ECF subfamily